MKKLVFLLMFTSLMLACSNDNEEDNIHCRHQDCGELCITMGAEKRYCREHLTLRYHEHLSSNDKSVEELPWPYPQIHHRHSVIKPIKGHFKEYKIHILYKGGGIFYLQCIDTEEMIIHNNNNKLLEEDLFHELNIMYGGYLSKD